MTDFGEQEVPSRYLCNRRRVIESAKRSKKTRMKKLFVADKKEQRTEIGQVQGPARQEDCGTRFEFSFSASDNCGDQDENEEDNNEDTDWRTPAAAIYLYIRIKPACPGPPLLRSTINKSPELDYPLLQVLHIA